MHTQQSLFLCLFTLELFTNILQPTDRSKTHCYRISSLAQKHSGSGHAHPYVSTHIHHSPAIHCFLCRMLSSRGKKTWRALQGKGGFQGVICFPNTRWSWGIEVYFQPPGRQWFLGEKWVGSHSPYHLLEAGSRAQ